MSEPKRGCGYRKIIYIPLIISGLIVFFIDIDLDQHKRLYRFWMWLNE